MAATPPDVVEIREQVYKDPRPKEHFDVFHARTRKGEPDWVYEAVRMVTSLYAWTFFRRRVSFMAKSQLFVNPMQWIYTHGGVFPVRRGYADEEAFRTANAVLERGGAIVMYCEGGRSRTAELSEQPKRGIGRLALESGAPVVPVAIHGSSHVRNWKRGHFPKVDVAYGDVIQWDRITEPTPDQQQAVANEIFSRVKTLYTGLD